MQFLKTSSFAHDVLKLVGGTTTAQVISFLMVPVLARLYLPEAFGTLSVFNSIVSILVVISCLRYEFAIQLPKEEQEASNLLFLCISIAFVLSIVVAIVVIFLRKQITLFLNVPNLVSILWILPVVVFAGGVFQVFSQWSSRRRDYGQISVAQASKAVATSFSQFGLSIGGYNTSSSLVWGVFIGTLAASLGLGSRIWFTDRRSILSHFDVQVMKSILIRYRKFPIFDIWGALLNALSWQLPVFMLAIFFSETIVGNYGMASRLVYFPMSLIGSSIGQVFFQRASQLQANNQSYKHVIDGLLERMVALVMYPALLMTLLGKPITQLFLGSEWAEAGSYMQILGLWSFFWFISSPLSTVFLVMGKQHSLLLFQIFIFISRLISLAVGGFLHNVQVALILFSISGVLVYGVLLIWEYRLSELSISRLINIIKRYFLISIPSVFFVVVAKVLLTENLILLVLVGVLSATLYYLTIFRKYHYLYKSVF